MDEIKTIFCEALSKRDPDERAAFLDRACGEDAEMRAQIESLLSAHEKIGDFLPSAELEDDETLDRAQSVEGPGTVIGRYRLLEQIGEGGMAVVYMAEQQEPVKRRVALKIIKLGMDSKSVIARFEAERQALAVMDHPNIAKVFDGGTTEKGRPYFVMELVKGVSITEYCDSNKLTTRERLQLFVQVCDAVQHAHQKGIIHRDIKPSNVMVTLHGDRPVPKVIDFGIAKATNQRLTEKTFFTRYAQMIGTPEYMSPEQAQMSGLDVDTRSDVYSLGVLLYKLLTGTTPFDAARLYEAGYAEIQRIIREEDPVKPSTKLSTMGEELTDVARDRKANPSMLRRLIAGDVDWIVMKSLEKDRTRRYDTVSSLAMDVQRHLRDEPILARAPGSIYVLRKFLRRHRKYSVAALIAVPLVIAMIVVLSLWGRDRVRIAREEALKHRDIMTKAKTLFENDDLLEAAPTVELVLDSRHVGSEAQTLHNRILDNVQEQIRLCTEAIKNDPNEAENYLKRAQYLHCLHDRDAEVADMGRYLAALYPDEGVDSQHHPFRDLLTRIWTATPVNLEQINSPAEDLSPCISKDNLVLIFNSRRARGSNETSLWTSKRASVYESWGKVESIGPPVDGPTYDSSPALSADGRSLYFSSNRGGGLGSQDLYVARRQGENSPWGSPEHLETLSSTESDWGPAISADGLELLFTSRRAGDHNIYVSRRATEDEPWGEPSGLGAPINVEGSDAGEPALTNDGLTLFFCSYRPGGSGQVDLWASRRATRDSDWGPPVNLGPTVNSPGSEVGPCISADNSTLYFATQWLDEYGTLDLWRISLLSAGGDRKEDGDPETGL